MKNKQWFTAEAGTKRAFTLAEVLMVLFIIGIITVFSILTLKRGNDEFGPLYYRAFEALKIANYNSYIDMHPKYPRKYPSKIHAETDEFYKTGTDEQIKEWLSGRPETDSDPGTEGHPGGICERLLEWINISEGTKNCEATLIDPNGDDSQFDGNLKPGGHLAFKGSNSQRFYFGAANNSGDIIKSELDSEESDPDHPGQKRKQTVGWFIVYVDLNGERGPNSTTVVNGKSPDIVAFALTDHGGVAPIGMPRVERKYLTAKVGYPDIYCDTKRQFPTKYGCVDDGNKISRRFSNTMAYQEAVRHAWGCTLGVGDPKCADDTLGTKEIADEADTIDFTLKTKGKPTANDLRVLKSIRNEYTTLTKSTATIDDRGENSKNQKTPPSAAPDKLPGDCVPNDPFGNPCKVIVEKYQR